ncbi:glutathione S-transferase [Dichotomopilus funicola]|uniref:Glutathione S-transferase n=1 Tax=Dichotomopilus funicola TaxID=1934379 RepID=A0AAN6V607_9PEZI|nr:glutathione S-transferase [Dichotomopilus funicola]
MSTPDTTIHPHPTGAAASLASAHANPVDPQSYSTPGLRLYGGWFCPFVQRSWIVLAEKQIPYQYVEINPYRKEAEFLRLNPRGLVPTLAVVTTTEQDGSGGGRNEKEQSLGESAVICEYLDEQFADEGVYGPRLLPAESEGVEAVFERARCRLWINHIATRIVPAFYRLLQHTEEKVYTIEEARRELLKGLREFAAEMVRTGRKGPWFLGGRFSLVDVMLAPWAKRLFLIDHYKPGGVGIPGKGERKEEEEGAWARWDEWFAAVVERESVKATWSEEEKYIEVYKRYAEDTTQSEVGQATRKGRGLP